MAGAQQGLSPATIRSAYTRAMSKFARGLALIKESWGVLKQNPGLLALPALSFTALLLLFMAIATPFIAEPELLAALSRDDATGQRQTPILYYVVLGVFYFAMNFIIVFFNVALIACVIERLSGRPASIGFGLKASMSRLPQIVGWAALAATVGVILKALEERVPALGKIVVRMLGYGWAIVTFFVVPIVALEKLGPIDAVKRSTEVIKRTWGESLTGTVGLGFLSFLLMLPGFFILGFGFWRVVESRPTPDWTPMILAGIFAVAYFIAVGLVMSLLKQIFIAGAYVYATSGQLPSGFTQDSLSAAFRTKGR